MNWLIWLAAALLISSVLSASEHIPSKDWQSLFEKTGSADAAVREQGTDLVFQLWLPDICEEDTQSAKTDAIGIAPFLRSDNPRIRLDSSALLTAMTTQRKDSESVMAPILPQIAAAATSNPIEDRVRRNALNILSSLHPSVPDAAVTTLLGLANKHGESLLPAAHISAGLARRPDRPDATNAIHTSLQAASSSVWKQAALSALITAPPAPPQVVADIGPLVFDPNKEVQDAALNLLARNRSYAIISRSFLMKLSEMNTSPSSEKAKQILQQVSQ